MSHSPSRQLVERGRILRCGVTINDGVDAMCRLQNHNYHDEQLGKSG